jgi:hypothetical protein
MQQDGALRYMQQDGALRYMQQATHTSVSQRL